MFICHISLNCSIFCIRIKWYFSLKLQENGNFHSSNKIMENIQSAYKRKHASSLHSSQFMTLKAFGPIVTQIPLESDLALIRQGLCMEVPELEDPLTSRPAFVPDTPRFNVPQTPRTRPSLWMNYPEELPVTTGLKDFVVDEVRKCTGRPFIGVFLRSAIWSRFPHISRNSSKKFGGNMLSNIIPIVKTSNSTRPTVPARKSSFANFG